MVLEEDWAIGFSCHFSFSLKALFQNLWKQKFEWHECISDEFKGDWDNILLDLIPTKVLNHNEGDVSQRVDLHGFSEASQ